MEELFENIPSSGLVIQEAKGGLKEGVLAVVKGPSFFSDGYSRNGRFYPKELWENALKVNNTKEAISRGLMFGCIGHPKDYSLDELLESGKVSHKVVDITLDPKTGDGIATYEIMDTPSGRILNTILRSGSEMYVSTRAFGGFTNETKRKGGKEYKILDTKNFELESIDFVIQPGFLQTNPKLVESISEDMAMLMEDKSEIKCSEGICQLHEDMGSINEDLDGAPDLFEDIEDLSKADIINMLKNVVAENKILSEEQAPVSTNTEADKEEVVDVNKKLLATFLSYVEILTKLVRYSVEFEAHYEALIEFLDKDNKMSIADVKSMSAIVEKILAEELLDESIIVVCNNIQNVIAVISSTKTDEEKIESFDDNLAEVMASLIFRESTNFALVEAESTVLELKGQNARLREATIVLSEQPMKTEIVEVEKEVVIEKEVSVTPKAITEKLVTLTEENKRLLEEVENARSEISDMSEGQEELVEELSAEVESLKETISENNGFAKEALIENKATIKELQESLATAENTVSVHEAKVSKMVAKVASAEKAKLEAQIACESSVYRLDKKIVATIFENFKGKAERESALKKQVKMQRKNKPIKEEVPQYEPKKRQREATSRLESLIS